MAALSARACLQAHGVADRACEIAVVAPMCELVLRPRLHERQSKTMRVSLEPLFDATHIRFMPGLIWRVSSQAQTLDAVEGNTPFGLRFDRLILAQGRGFALDAVPGMRAFGYTVDSVAEASRLEADYERLMWRSTNWTPHTVVIVGGGLAGVEIATNLIARLEHFDRLMGSIKVILVEQQPEIAACLGTGARRVVAKALRRVGVDCLVGTTVTRITAEGVVLDSGQFLAAAMTIWAGGTTANVLNHQLPWAKNERQQIHAIDDLSVPGLHTVYVAGDNATLQRPGQPDVIDIASAMRAVLSGRIAGHNAAASLIGASAVRMPDEAPPVCIDLGSAGALVTSGCGTTVRATGEEAKAMRLRLMEQTLYPPPPIRDAALSAAAVDLARPLIPEAAA